MKVQFICFLLSFFGVSLSLLGGISEPELRPLKSVIFFFHFFSLVCHGSFWDSAPHSASYSCSEKFLIVIREKAQFLLKSDQTVRSNRMAGSNTRWSNGFLHGKSIKDEDFDEEAAWDFASEREEEEASSPISKKFNHCNSSGSSSSFSSSAWRMQSSAPKMIPKTKTTANQEPKTVKRSSAPLDIPDWSKIYGRNGNMSSWMDDEYGLVDGSACNGFVNDDDDDGEVMVPPHEWIARKLARSQISSFSVCEGIGRTLKGRDLSKVRNAILTKTGFLE